MGHGDTCTYIHISTYMGQGDTCTYIWYEVLRLGDHKKYSSHYQGLLNTGSNLKIRTPPVLEAC